MSIKNQHDMMKTSFLESKDVINQIFTLMGAPEHYFIIHMTFDELLVALYRILRMFESTYGSEGGEFEYIVNTKDGDATEDDILLNKIAYAHGEKIIGKIVSLPEHTYTAGVDDIVIPEGHYLSGNIIIKGDVNLIPENIKGGVTIFDVTGENEHTINEVLYDEQPYIIIPEGWHNEGRVEILFDEDINVLPTTVPQTIEASDKHVLRRVIVEGDDDLISNNIRQNTVIFGVEGNINVAHTGDGTATAGEIRWGKIAYVQGERIVGAMASYTTGDIILDEEYSTHRLEEGYHTAGTVSIQTQEKYAHPTIHEQIIEPDDNHVLSRVFVAGDEDLRPENIKKGVNIFDVVGTLEDYTKYNIVYIVNLWHQLAYQQSIEMGQSFQLMIPPMINDYIFHGWSTDYKATTAMYQGGQTISTDLANKGEVCLLYAVLEEDKLSDIEIKNIEYTWGGPRHGHDNSYGILEAGGETVWFEIHGGCGSDGYNSSINCTQECPGSEFVRYIPDTLTQPKAGDFYYRMHISFKKLGIFPFTVVHTKPNGKKAVGVAIFKVFNEDGSMSGDGSMILEQKIAYFDSGWITDSKTAGCYITSATVQYKTAAGHTSNHDVCAIFGVKTNGDNFILSNVQDGWSDPVTEWTENTNRKINGNFPTITGDLIKSNNYQLQIGDVQLINMSNNGLPDGNHVMTVTKTFTKEDDIRQVRFLLYSDHGTGKDCFANSYITYNVDYAFDMDLWEVDQGNPSNPSDPDNPNPDNPTTDGNNLDVWTNFNSRSLLDTLETRWGYYSLSKGAFSGYDTNKILTAYRRIYNAAKDNGKKNKYKCTLYGTNNTVERDARRNDYPSIALFVYLEDLNLPIQIVWRIHEYVFMDNADIMMDWNAKTNYTDDGCFGFAQYPETDRQRYLSKCATTFQHICAQINTTYGITYVEDTFTNNYKRYSALDKKRIGKVIHDYIINHSNYSFRNTETNQTAYPALSEGEADPVCASYAQAFCYCCNKFGILSTAVLGLGDAQDTSAYHEWAMVNYTTHNIGANENPWDSSLNSDEWQDIDVTWDDPVWDDVNYTNMYPDFISWWFFNKTTEYFINFKHIRKLTNPSNGTTDCNSVYVSYPTANSTCTANTYGINSTDEGGIVYGGF